MENTFTLAEFLEKKVKDYTPPQFKRKGNRAGALPSQGHHAAL